MVENRKINNELIFHFKEITARRKIRLHGGFEAMDNPSAQCRSTTLEPLRLGF